MNGEIIWKGSHALSSRLAPIKTLTLHPGNPRRGAVAEVAASLERFGQIRPVLVDDSDTVIAGNHTLRAAEQLGWTHVAFVRNDFKTPEAASAYLLADNRLAELGGYDRAEQIALVAELEESGRWQGTGYTADDLEHMRAMEAAASAPPPEPPAPLPAAPPAPPNTLREVVLLFDEQQKPLFGQGVRTLLARYGLEGVSETVLRALHDEAFLVNQGSAA